MLRYLFLVYFAIIICIYYIIGGEKFPDYLSYMKIADGDYVNDFSRNYIFEWISIGWLVGMPSLLGDSKLTVDLLALGVQFVYFYWVIKTPKLENLTGKFWITAFSGALFLTTTLRGTVAYIASFMLVEKRPPLKYMLSIMALGLAFHDSFFVVILCYFSAMFLVRFFTTVKLAFLTFISCFVIVFGSRVLGGLSQLILLFDIGAREVYLNNTDAPSEIKFAYALFIGLSIFIILYGKNRLASLEETYLVILYLVSCIIFSISHTSGIRMLLYVSGCSLLLLARHSYWGVVMRRPIILIFIPPVFLFISFFDLFRYATH